MATFTLKIKCDNAAFDPEPGIELARILRTIADRVESEGTTELRGRAMDSNGNSVGEYKLTP
jgi:hypothetical protein